MSDAAKVLIVVLGGLAIMASTTIGGAAILVYTTPLNTGVNDIGAGLGSGAWHLLKYGFKGAVIGAAIGSALWVMLGYFVFRMFRTSNAPPAA